LKAGISTQTMLSGALVQLRSDDMACRIAASRQYEGPFAIRRSRLRDGGWFFAMKDDPTLMVEKRVMSTSESRNVAPKMLVADDDPCVVRALVKRCTRMGFEVETAANGLQALIKANRRRPDILVIDVHMPEIDGFAVCAHLSGPEMKSMNVIVMTGHSSPEMAEWCGEFGAIYTHKGANFWGEFEAALCEIFPERAFGIRQADGQTAKAAMRSRARVLVIDDDANVRKFLSSRLEGLGVEPLLSSDGTRGFWKARREEPTVIVSDYFMKNGGAEYLLLRLRVAPETRNIPVIVHSARTLDDLTKQRLRQEIHGQPGAARILRKAPGAMELLEAIQRFCGFVINPVADYR
jgi:CheY-like chemotaxis protein